jgi:hypothetical protein
MKSIGDIDPLIPERPMLPYRERQKLRSARSQQQKHNGYQILVEFCHMGEYDAARQLANKNPSWGYEIIDGEVMEKIDDIESDEFEGLYIP